MARKTNRNNTMWSKKKDGRWVHASGSHEVRPTETGKRWIATVDGEDLVGDSGAVRYFGSADTALAAAKEVIGDPEPVKLEFFDWPKAA